VKLVLVGDRPRCGCASNASCRGALPRDKARGLKARGTASGMITPGEAATIAAELAMPDLDLIKQGEQEVQGLRERFATGRTGHPAGRPRGWWLTPLSGRSRPATSNGVCSMSRPTTPTPLTPQSARMAPTRIGSTTHGRDLAADWLQIAGRETIDSNYDCVGPGNFSGAGGPPPGSSRFRRSAVRAARSRPSPRGSLRRPGSPAAPSP